MKYLEIVGLSFVIFLVIDMIWLGLIAKKLYAKQLGYLMTPNINWIAAIVFYIIFILGLSFFVIEPAIIKESLQYAILAGMFFGFVTYATYDLTNLATVDKWPLLITGIDLVWGTFLGGVVSTLTFLILR